MENVYDDVYSHLFGVNVCDSSVRISRGKFFDEASDHPGNNQAAGNQAEADALTWGGGGGGGAGAGGGGASERLPTLPDSKAGEVEKIGKVGRRHGRRASANGGGGGA